MRGVLSAFEELSVVGVERNNGEEEVFDLIDDKIGARSHLGLFSQDYSNFWIDRWWEIVDAKTSIYVKVRPEYELLELSLQGSLPTSDFHFLYASCLSSLLPPTMELTIEFEQGRLSMDVTVYYMNKSKASVVLYKNGDRWEADRDYSPEISIVFPNSDRFTLVLPDSLQVTDLTGFLTSTILSALNREFLTGEKLLHFISWRWEGKLE
jgi:hypothetical protein